MRKEIANGRRQPQRSDSDSQCSSWVRSRRLSEARLYVLYTICTRYITLNIILNLFQYIYIFYVLFHKLYIIIILFVISDIWYMTYCIYIYYIALLHIIQYRFRPTSKRCRCASQTWIRLACKKFSLCTRSSKILLGGIWGHDCRMLSSCNHRARSKVSLGAMGLNLLCSFF